MPSQYRLSKYNLEYRNIDWYYIKDEWTEVSEIWSVFDGVEFTLADYLETEKLYIVSLLKILNVNSIPVSSLRVQFSPNQSDYFQEWSEGNIIKYIIPWQVIENELMLWELIRPLLRYENWYRIESEDFFIHFWFDSYCRFWFFDLSKSLLIPELPDKIYVESLDDYWVIVKKEKRNLKYNPKTWKWWSQYIKKLERRLKASNMKRSAK